MHELLMWVWTISAPAVSIILGGLAILIGFVVLGAARNYAKSLKDARIQAWAEYAVAAAEQLWDGESGAGEEKYSWVAYQLQKRGLPADAAAIEAAVYDLRRALPASWGVGLSEPVVTGAPMVDEPSS